MIKSWGYTERSFTICQHVVYPLYAELKVLSKKTWDKFVCKCVIDNFLRALTIGLPLLKTLIFIKSDLSFQVFAKFMCLTSCSNFLEDLHNDLIYITQKYTCALYCWFSCHRIYMRPEHEVDLCYELWDTSCSPDKHILVSTTTILYSVKHKLLLPHWFHTSALSSPNTQNL